MMKKLISKFLIATFLLLLTNVLSAQKTVTGKVFDSNSQPVAGATVSIRGTNAATQTDASGNFSIIVPSGRNTLSISSVGFTTQEINVATLNMVSLTLVTSTSTLDEVLVTGYSTQRKKDITGSVSVVNVKDLRAIPAGSPVQMLQGRASGVNVITSGQPGSGSNIRIRGITAFGSVEPLVIIDGVQAGLNNINAEDIESMQVLKDAGAASIYGVRGANGVIVVTTKKGKAGKATISYDSYYGTQRPLKNGFDLLNPQEMADLTWLAYRNSNTDIVNGNPNHPQYGNGVKPVLPEIGRAHV